MARFISKESRPDLKYNPLSYDEITRIPLMLQARDEAIMNDANAKLDQYSLIRVPEDQRALKIYNEFGDKLRNQVQGISETIMKNGSLDPAAMGSIRSLKRNYTDTVGVNGIIGKLAEDRATIDAQRAALQISHTAQGNRPENFNDIFNSQVQEHYNQYDNLANDPNFMLKTFTGKAAPKRESVENMMARIDKSLGSISTSTNTQTVVANPSAGGITLNYADSSEANSSNEKALQAATDVVMMSINDPNSELMQSIIYNNPGVPVDQLQYQAARELASRVTSRLRTTHQEASGQDVRFVSNADSNGVNSNSKSTTTDNSSEGNSTATLAYQDTNYEASEEFKDVDELGKIYSGQTEAELEALEQQLSRMNPNAPGYKDIQSDIIKRKARITSIKFKIAEDLHNNPDFYKNYAKTFKARKSEYDRPEHKAALRYKFKGGNTLENYLSSEQGIKNLIQGSENYNKYFQKNPTVAEGYNLLKGNGVFIDSNGGLTMYAPAEGGKIEVIGSKDNSGAIRKYAQRTGKSFYGGKEGIRKYLQQKGIVMTDGEFNNFYTNIADKQMLDYGVKSINNSFIKEHYGPGKGEIGISSNRIVIPNAETNAKYSKNITAMGGTTIVNEFKSSKNNFFYEDGGSNGTSFIKSIDTQDDSDTQTFLKDLALQGTFEFDSIIERGPGKPSTIMLRASAKNGETTTTKMMGIDINAKNTAQGKSSNSVLIDELINMTTGVDRSRLIAIRDNARYDNIYVDTPDVGTAGVSKHQNQQMKSYVSSRSSQNSYYKKASPILSAQKSNIVAHRNGYHSFNYVDNNNQTKTLTLGQYIIKDKINDEIENNSFSTVGITDERQISSLTYNPTVTSNMNLKAVEFIRYMQNTARLIERIDSNGNRTNGVIRIEDDAKTNQFMSAFDEMEKLENATDINQLLNIAKGMYSIIKDVPLMHRNKLKGA